MSSESSEPQVSARPRRRARTQPSGRSKRKYSCRRRQSHCRSKPAKRAARADTWAAWVGYTPTHARGRQRATCVSPCRESTRRGLRQTLLGQHRTQRWPRASFLLPSDRPTATGVKSAYRTSKMAHYVHLPRAKEHRLEAPGKLERRKRLAVNFEELQSGPRIPPSTPTCLGPVDSYAGKLQRVFH